MSTLASLTNTTAAIADITIGERGGAANLAIDFAGDNTALLNGGNIITFAHNDSHLLLGNKSIVGNKTLTLHADLTGGGDDKGILTINSGAHAGVGNKELIIASNGAETIGIAIDDRIRELKVTGDQKAPAYLNLPITSLKNEGINLANPDKFLNTLMNKFNKLYLSWQYEGGFEQTRNDWLKRAYNLNNIVTIDNGLQRISGIFKSIEKDGVNSTKLFFVTILIFIFPSLL